MKKTITTTLAAVTASMSINALADFHLSNQSDIYITGRLDKFAACSSSLGKKGIIAPGQTSDVPQDVLNAFCTFSECHVYVYNSKNCSGTKLADITVTAQKGITKLVNLTTEYNIEHAGSYVTLTNAS